MLQFVAERDSCREQLQKPVFRVRTDEGEIWPLVVLQQVFMVSQDTCLFCVLYFAYRFMYTLRASTTFIRKQPSVFLDRY